MADPTFWQLADGSCVSLTCVDGIDSAEEAAKVLPAGAVQTDEPTFTAYQASLPGPPPSLGDQVTALTATVSALQDTVTSVQSQVAQVMAAQPPAATGA